MAIQAAKIHASITVTPHDVAITTRAGTFHMAPPLYQGYCDHFSRFGAVDQFHDIVERATLPASPSRASGRWYQQAVDTALRAHFDAHSINADEYLGLRDEELRNLLPADVVDVIRQEAIFTHFDRGHDQNTWLEHRTWGSSTPFDRGNPFSGGYVVPGPERTRLHADREVFLGGERAHYSLFIYSAALQPPASRSIRKFDVFLFDLRNAARTLRTAARSVLEPIYRQAHFCTMAPESFDAIDHVAVELQATPYDDACVAVPEAVGLKFFVGNDVVLQIKKDSTPEVARFQPSMGDVTVADLITDHNGVTHGVQMITQGAEHYLTAIPFDASPTEGKMSPYYWFAAYCARVSIP